MAMLLTVDKPKAKGHQRSCNLCLCVYLPSGFIGFVLVNFYLWKLIIHCPRSEDNDDDNNNIPCVPENRA